MKPGRQGDGTEHAGEPKRRRRSARGVLWLITAAFALSGLLRLGSGTSEAIAAGVASGFDAAMSTEATDCAQPADIAEVLEALEAREARVAVREAAVADRMQALELAEVQVRENLAALEAAEASLEATISAASTAAEGDLARLTSVYENMKPKEASPLFAAMDPQFAAGFLARMRPDTAAAILAGLDPATAYSISVILAGRNADVPTK
ncbi:hypothetical protein GCM10011358_04150 [Sinisalibacter lacisalsi]|uniref:Magnesium transporter MgtE intracellular domain-containing protein n=2 Tax=Sinisalibacter lacisalsi TaxID=1526570 RepID=A0ABQ1QEA7_9RHOB|nr:hypothetical protein GCM10011358_04150 [Sinisalibacter lacisalsi]